MSLINAGIKNKIYEIFIKKVIFKINISVLNRALGENVLKILNICCWQFLFLILICIMCVSIKHLTLKAYTIV